jgi:hypothetical protein
MKTPLTALATLSLGSLLIACASLPDRSAPLQRFAIKVDYPDVVMPTIGYEPEVAPEPALPSGIPEVSSTFMCGGVFSEVVPAPVPAYTTTWRVRSVSKTEADLYGDVEQPSVIFHLEATSP